ncbi:MAG TPA: hypothetical protein P5248_11855, partial [Bacteroidales bacterium]|nr:hypothetical protein [Bacteroidales bacterium]
CALLIWALLLSSCGTDTGEQGEVVTRRIQYDVTIKSPDPTYDWWVQNIEGQDREALVRDLLSAAYEGRVKAWDIFHQPLSPEQVKAIGNRTDTLTYQRSEEPYDLYDTVVTQTLSLNDITRIRFLEEWRSDASGFGLSKRVIGICPLLERYGPEGELRGYMPMFWIYYDPEYPGVFTAGAP